MPRPPTNRVSKSMSFDAKILSDFLQICIEDGKVPAHVIDQLMLDYVNANGKNANDNSARIKYKERELAVKVEHLNEEIEAFKYGKSTTKNIREAKADVARIESQLDQLRGVK